MKSFLKILFFVTGFGLFIPLASYGQSLGYVEYFVDTDPGVGNGNGYATGPSDTIIDSLNFAIPGLGPGFHTIFFRTRDTNGTWSLYDGMTVFVQDTVVPAIADFDSSSAEYFFDADTGAGTGTAILLTPGDSLSDTVLAGSTGLAPGFHSIYLRAKDSNNVWSLYDGGKFYVQDTVVQTISTTYPLEQAEYFYDTDPGTGNGIAMNSFSLADTITLTDTLPSATLTAGTHRLYVRVRDSMNVWSLYEGMPFVVCNFIPAANFSADTVCVNSPMSFTDLSSNVDTSFAYTYGWDFNNDHVIDDTTRTNTTHVFNVSGTHTISLIVNNTNGCSDTVVKTVYVDSLPIVTFNFTVDTICTDDTLLLAGGSPAGGTYSGSGVYGGFFYGDSVSSGNHTIVYTYYNSDSCMAFASDIIYVDDCLGINEVKASDFRFQVNPNPFSFVSNLQIASTEFLNGTLELKIYDVYGKEVRSTFLSSARSQISRDNLASGIYFIKFVSGENILGTGKLVVAD